LNPNELTNAAKDVPTAPPQVRFEVRRATERAGEGEPQAAEAGMATTTLGMRAT